MRLGCLTNVQVHKSYLTLTFQQFLQEEDLGVTGALQSRSHVAVSCSTVMGWTGTCVCHAVLSQLTLQPLQLWSSGCQRSGVTFSRIIFLCVSVVKVFLCYHSNFRVQDIA